MSEIETQEQAQETIVNPAGLEAIQTQMTAQNDRLLTAYQQKTAGQQQVEEADKIIAEANGIIAMCQFSMQAISQEHQALALAKEAEDNPGDMPPHLTEVPQTTEPKPVPPAVAKAAAEAAGHRPGSK